MTASEKVAVKSAQKASFGKVFAVQIAAYVVLVVLALIPGISYGHPIDLAYKEFELLKYLVQHPGRVFTRAQLLQEVWGYDYYGGTRTVDVHIRRLRAKLGGEYEHVIGTVRNVGYRFDPPEEEEGEAAAKDAAAHNASSEN